MRIHNTLLLGLGIAMAVPGLADVIYTTGSPKGTSNALFIAGPNSGSYNQSISDSFVAGISGTPTALDLGVWTPAGTTPVTLTWMLGTTAFSGDISSGTSTLVNPTLVVADNQYGYDVYDVQVNGLSGFVIAGGTYYLTLVNANDSGGTQRVAWDVNGGGSGACYYAINGANNGICGWSGPEAFTLYGEARMPEPGSMLLAGSGLLALAALLRRAVRR